MNRSLTTHPRKLLIFLLKYCIIMSALNTILGISSAIYYICDLIVCVLLIFVIKRFNLIIKNSVYRYLGLIFIVLFFLNLIGEIVNYVSLPMILWGGRNFYRYYVVYFGLLIYMKQDDVENIMRFFFKMHVLNFLVGLYKFFVLHLSADAFAGGVFPNGASLNPFCLLLICYYSCMYFVGKATLKRNIFIIVSVYALAAMGEEKMLMIMSAVALVMVYMVNRLYEKNISKTSLKFAMVLFGGMLIGAGVIMFINPDTLAIITDLTEIKNYASLTYNEGYRLPRLGAFEIIDTLFLKTTFNKWFGLGLGNCDSSNYDIFQSDFYKMYGNYNYKWFTHQWTYLEGGRIGFGLYLLFFISIIVILIFRIKKSDVAKRPLLIVSIVFTVTVIAFIWHSSALRIDMGYISYFGMAIGLIALKDEDSLAIKNKQRYF